MAEENRLGVSLGAAFGYFTFSIFVVAFSRLALSERRARDQVRLKLHYQASHLRLCVEDNGVGASSADSGGYGLAGLRERVRLIGGAVSVGTYEGAGFALEVEVPA